MTTATCNPSYKAPLIGLSTSFERSGKPSSFGYFNGEEFRAVHLDWTPAREPLRKALKAVARGQSVTIPAGASKEEVNFIVGAIDLAQRSSAKRQAPALAAV